MAFDFDVRAMERCRVGPQLAGSVGGKVGVTAREPVVVCVIR